MRVLVWNIIQHFTDIIADQKQTLVNIYNLNMNIFCIILIEINMH